MGCERGVSGSQTRFSRAGNPLLSITLSIGAGFHRRGSPEAWNRCEVAPEVSSPDSTAGCRRPPQPPLPSCFAPRRPPPPPPLQNPGTPRQGPLTRRGAAGWVRAGRRERAAEGCRARLQDKKESGADGGRPLSPPGGEKLLPPKLRALGSECAPLPAPQPPPPSPQCTQGCFLSETASASPLSFPL